MIQKRQFRLLLVSLATVFVVSTGIVVLSGTVAGQSVDVDPTSIVEEVQPSEASQEQIEAVESWFYSQDDLDQEVRNEVGRWLQQARQSSSESSGNTVEDPPSDVVAEINDNLTLRDYSFDREAGTVTLVLSANTRTEQLTLTDPRSAEDQGVGTVNQQGVTVNRGETVEVEFDVGYSQYTGSSTVWVSAGAGETRYVSNEAQEIVNRLEWMMIPVSALAGALAVFLSGLIYVWREYRSLNQEYTNVFKRS
jgi:hypothetical protein